jgi:hypothetical protein
MKYKIQTSFGCTSNCISINDKLYIGEDPRYCLSGEERLVFNEDLFNEIKRMFDDGEINIINLIEHLHIEDIHYSETCDTCGDSVTTTKYEF